MQEKLQRLIQKYEEDINKLLKTKKKHSPNDELYKICEVKVLELQRVNADLRNIL